MTEYGQTMYPRLPARRMRTPPHAERIGSSSEKREIKEDGEHQRSTDRIVNLHRLLRPVHRRTEATK